MTFDDAKSRIEELKAIIKENNEAYYVFDAPKITDFEYDELYRELKRLEEEFPEAYFEELALNSLDTQEGNSGIYSLRWETASSMQEGEVCSPYEQEGTYCVIKCLSREENQAVSYEDVESRIERTLQVEEASEYISKMGEDMEIREGEISAEEVILGAVSG